MARADSDSEDEYGDDFEDYYEQVELQAPAPSKHQASTLTGASKRKSSPGPALSDLEAIQDALKNAQITNCQVARNRTRMNLLPTRLNCPNERTTARIKNFPSVRNRAQKL